MSKILVTGGAGFIASNIVDRLIENNHDVTVIDNLSTGKRGNVNPGAHFYEMDIRDTALREIFDITHPDMVSHHAAQMDIRKSVSNPSYDLDVNGMGLLNVLECSRKYGVKKVIYASSGGAIYGETENAAKETDDKKPMCPYGITKLLGEHYLDYYNKVHGMNYTTLRYGNVYGPRQDSKGEAGVIDIFISQMLKSKPVSVFGDGEQLRDYIFVSDVVEANYSALSKGDNQAFNIGTGRTSSVNQLFGIIKEQSNYQSDAVYLPQRDGELLKSSLDCSKSRVLLGWKSKVSLEDGIKQTMDWIKNGRDPSSKILIA